MFFTTAFYLVTSLISIESAFSVLARNLRSHINIIYFILAIDFAICSLTLVHISSAIDVSICYLWYYINVPFGCLLSVLVIHYTIVFTGISLMHSKVTIVLLYIVPALFCIAIYRGVYFIPDFVKSEWGWDTVIHINSAWTYLFIVFYLIPPVLSLIIYLYWKNTLQKDSFRDITAKLTVPYITVIAAVILCPYFIHFEGKPFINILIDMGGQTAFTVFIVSQRIYLNRLRQVRITEDTTAEELITSLNEPVFLVMRGGKILSYNKYAEELIDISFIEKQTSLYDIFDCPFTMQKIIQDIIERKSSKSEVRCSVTIGRNKTRSFTLNLQPLFNASSELTGFIIFAKEDRTLAIFKDKYRITDRQLDIIFMAAAGLSNREIAEKFKIKEKTVENHLFNIYNKLGVDNKIELNNLSREYNIIPD
ncbi:MAG TPA: LuxR C-terminal-related transcriptional regulator [Spirochaetota bacterium]|nr:LuxR C-terminal-related transcriptional regulator [Spirochaetota bacterium]HPJ42668.1 LuxR C-terminal-related transcriptional regulator [Spirochaetota bacterium]HPR37577.1 LuxR C-terminal-related transcriptional regulator [Spirochaetota bacterium]HRX47660.1 LuxR C-terminal-related transcriptional regulator [Spirochaetota bacterium]